MVCQRKKWEMSKHTSKHTGNIGTIANAKWERIRRERDPLRPSSETKYINKWQKPSLNIKCLPICKPNRHKKHINKHIT